MSYNTNNLTTAAQCDAALTMANDRKGDMQFALTSATRQSNDIAARRARYTSTLVSVNAQITGLEAGIPLVTDETILKKMNSQLRKLNDRKANLEESIENGSAGSLLEDELDKGLLNIQVGEIDSFITEVTTRKAAL